MYVSFKYGDFEGTRNALFYLDVTEQSIVGYLKDSQFVIIDTKISEDVRSDKYEKWLNEILKKKG